MNGDNQALHEFCLRWVEWSRTRRLYAPLRPKNILLRLREPAGLGDERDAELDAALNLFNMALKAYPEGRSKQAFMAFYLGHVRPIKRAAYELGYSRMGFFKAVRRVRENVYAASHRLRSEIRMQERTGTVR